MAEVRVVLFYEIRYISEVLVLNTTWKKSQKNTSFTGFQEIKFHHSKHCEIRRELQIICNVHCGKHCQISVILTGKVKTLYQ